MLIEFSLVQLVHLWKKLHLKLGILVIETNIPYEDLYKYKQYNSIKINQEWFWFDKDNRSEVFGLNIFIVRFIFDKIESKTSRF